MTDDKKKEAANLPEPPAGMQQSDTALDAQPKHDFDKVPLLEGTVKKVKDVEATNRSTGEVRPTQFAVIELADKTEVQLWKSANLEDLFNKLAVGGSVWVLYKGMTDLDNGNRMRKFDAYYS